MTKPHVFVFGSNEAGRHGKGAALFAAKHYGARLGEGRGRTGNAYALPTKDARLRPVSLATLAENVEEFIEHARAHPADRFLLTPVGCGRAGFNPGVVAEMFRGRLPANVALHQSWLEHFADLKDGG